MATPTKNKAEASEKVPDTEKKGLVDDEPPAAAIGAIAKRKEPPPEKPESIRIRSFVILSFWAIVLFLGLPIWWRTTAIYRARLPLDAMMEWADGRVSTPLSP